MFYVFYVQFYVAILGAIKGSSTEKLYQELGIEHLRSRRWFRKYAFSTKYLRTNYLRIYLIYIQVVVECTLPETHIT